MGMFDSLFTNEDSQNAAAAKARGYDEGFKKAKKNIGEGVTKYNQYANQASDLFDPYYSQGTAANTMYGNAIGLNGAEGNAAAVGAFQTGPGYNFQFDQGLQAIDRGAASRGMLSSGNLIQAEQKYGSDLANQEYQNWLKNLQFGATSGQSAAGSQAGILTGQGNTAVNAANKIADYGWQQETGIGNANAAAELANGQAAQNMFGAITSGLNLAGKVIGMGM